MRDNDKNWFAMNLVIDSKQTCGIQVFVSDKLVNKSDTDGTVLYLKAFFFYQKCFASVRGYLAEKIFQRGYILEKSLTATSLTDGH